MTTLDIREIEAGIRDAYRRLDLAAKARYRNPANWEGRHGAAVDLADLREALPADWDKAQVDVALGLLSDHADVHMWPKNDQKHAAARDADAAVYVGAKHQHTISIDRQPPEAEQVVERLRMRDRDHAQSQVAALDEATLTEVAAQMGVDPDTDPDVLRQRLVDKSVSNLDTWMADARQGQEDGTLLYRADVDPEWVASWTDQDRQQVAAAAARLQERAATDQYWAFVKDRADRWANATDQHTDQYSGQHTSERRDRHHGAHHGPDSHATGHTTQGEPAMNHGDHGDHGDRNDNTRAAADITWPGGDNPELPAAQRATEMANRLRGQATILAQQAATAGAAMREQHTRTAQAANAFAAQLDTAAATGTVPDTMLADAKLMAYTTATGGWMPAGMHHQSPEAQRLSAAGYLTGTPDPVDGKIRTYHTSTPQGTHTTDQMASGEPAMNHGNHSDHSDHGDHGDRRDSNDQHDNNDQHTATHVYDTVNADSIQFGSSGPTGPTGPVSGGHATSGHNGPRGQFSVSIGNLNAADVAYGDDACAGGSAGASQGWSVSGASVQVTGDGDGWTAQVSHPDGHVEYHSSARVDEDEQGWDA